MKGQKSSLRYWLLGLLLVLAVVSRSYKINNSMTEWFSWRQSDTLAVGRLLARENFNLLKPHYYDLSNIQSGMDNLEGLRLVEFPIYNALFGFLSKAAPVFSIEVWARITTIVFSLGIIVALFLLLEAEFGLTEAFFAGLYFAVSPYVVFYSRAVLPDMPATSLAVLSIYFAYRYSKQSGWNWLVALILFTLALLVKPTVIFFALPIFYLLWLKPQNILHKFFKVGLFFALAVLPVFLWRSYIQQFPEGVPVNQWLLNSVNTQNGLESIFFRPAFFRWIFFERINNLLLGGYLTFFLLLGILVEVKKTIRLHWLFLATSLGYLFTFQGGNVQHDYYQILITPTIALLLGIGVGIFLRNKKQGYVFVRVLAVIGIFISATLFSYYQVKDYYVERPSLVLMADVVHSLTNEKDLVVTDTMGDTTLLYLADRRGFPAPYKEFPQLIEIGAKYFVTQNLDYKRTINPDYKLIFENSQFLIFAL